MKCYTEMSGDELLIHGFSRWRIRAKRLTDVWYCEIVYLVPEHLYDEIPDGKKLVCINGTIVTKGIDDIDRDTRRGLLAYGIATEMNAFQDRLSIFDQKFNFLE